MKDEKYIKRCLELAKKGGGHVSPNPMVGCVIVKSGKMLSEGYHHRFGGKHAEIDALDKAKGMAKGSTLYVNLEPCCFYGKTPACTERIIEEGIKKVVTGVRDPNEKVNGKGLQKLKKAGIAVFEDVLKDECRMINQFYFKWIKTGIPYVTLKAAQTKDGFVAGKDGIPVQITCKESMQVVHRMRSFYDAVLIGKGTAIFDNPSLTVRLVEGRQPKRIVLDTKGEILKDGRFKKYKLATDIYKENTIWIVGKDVKTHPDSTVKIIRSNLNKKGQLDLKDVLKELAKRNISSVMVEGGPQIWQSFIDERLADQVVLFTSPKKMNAGVKSLPGKNTFEDLKLSQVKRPSFGKDNSLQGYLNIH
jgi:diaminohydroxyphosphoribosylaminopyrimidine deaminase/5-amino-6-(5-phosphoribosylamino)uracil reductase